MLERHRARLLVVAAVGAYFGLVAALGGYARWSRLGVSSSSDWFGDLRSVTSAWECTRRGIAVLPTNPCDPYGRPANYPRLWLLPSHLGLGLGDTFAIGLLVVAVFLVAAVAVVPERASLWLGAVYALVLCSPAAMLGVQRGNVDLTLFALLVVGVLVSQKGVRGVVAGGACVLLAAALKLFPVFAVGFLVRRATRPAIAVATAVVAAFAVYALALHHQLHEAVSAVPQGDLFSYGVRRVSEWIGTGLSENVSTRLASFRAWDVVLVLATGVGAWLLAPRVRVGIAGRPVATRELDLFWAGACIYVCTYAVARNFDYRLVFLLLTVPQLVRWARDGSKLAWLTIAAMLLAMSLDEWTHPPVVGSPLAWWTRLTAIGPNAQTLPVAVVAQFVLFGALLCWLAATSPSLWRLGRTD